MLLAAEQMTNVAIAGRLDLDVDTVSRWRKRFVTEGVDGLRDRKRSGRPRSFPAEVVAEALDCACGLYLGDPTAWINDPTPTN